MLKEFMFNHDLANFVMEARSEGDYFEILLKMREGIYLHLEDLTESHARVLAALEEYKPELISKAEKFFDEGLSSCNNKGLFVMAFGEEYAVCEDGEKEPLFTDDKKECLKYFNWYTGGAREVWRNSTFTVENVAYAGANLTSLGGYEVPETLKGILFDDLLEVVFGITEDDTLATEYRAYGILTDCVYCIIEDGEEIIDELDTLFDLDKLYPASHWDD